MTERYLSIGAGSQHNHEIEPSRPHDPCSHKPRLETVLHFKHVVAWQLWEHNHRAEQIGEVRSEI